MASPDTDNLLELVRSNLEKAAKGDQAAAKIAADAFRRLDAELCKAESLLPEDWAPFDGDDMPEPDDDDDGDDLEGDDLEEEEEDAEAAAEMRRVLGTE